MTRFANWMDLQCLSLISILGVFHPPISTYFHNTYSHAISSDIISSICMGKKALASSMLLLLRNKAGISKLAVAKDWDCELVILGTCRT